jgi:ABC-type uncharacterized transport system fused permease/ATPase subunit
MLRRRARPVDPLLPAAMPAGGMAGSDDVGGGAAAARLGPDALRAVARLLRLAPPPPRAALLPAVIAVYVAAGYRLVLAPGTLYEALVAGEKGRFLAAFRAYVALAVFVVAVKVGRAALREGCALLLRERLGRALHGMYVSEGGGERGGDGQREGSEVPPYYWVNAGEGKQSVDNPDQRVVNDVRDFAAAAFEIVCGGSGDGGSGDSGGVLEATGSVAWYTFAVARRTGWPGVAVAYGWSLVVGAVTVGMVNFVSPWVFEAERLDARLRYAHVGLRDCAEGVAFLRGGDRERGRLDERLRAAVRNGWVLVHRHVYLNAVQIGFGYFVSLVMYGAIGLAVFSDVLADGVAGFSADMQPGDKAKWVSQTGGVFIQLLYSFTTFIQLGTVMTAFVANTARVTQVVDALEEQRRGKGRDTSWRRRWRQQRGGRISEQDKVSLLGDTMSGNNEDPEATAEAEAGTDADSDAAASESSLFAQDLVVRIPGPGGREVGPVDLRVEPGTWVMLAGQSGSGKTSVLRALRGLWAPTAGRVGVSGLREPGDDVMFSPQTPYIPDGMTLRELVMYPDRPSCSVDETFGVAAALAAVGWRGGVGAALLDDGSAGWAARLSPGERQLVSAARVVRRRPRFAVLDEPSSALDNESESRMFAALRATGAGVLAAGHKDALRRACDAVVTI